MDGRVVSSDVVRRAHHVTRNNTPIHNILSTAPQLSISQKALGMLPEDGNVMPKYVESTIFIIIFSGSAAQRGLWPPRSRGFLITHNDAPQSVGLLWSSDNTNTHNRQTSMPAVGFEPTITVG